jgi:hypothetical protein
MTGSARNNGRFGIVIGQPVAEDESGNLLPADANHLAFAVATVGGPPGANVGYTTDGIVTRTDWTMVAGTQSLVPGKPYFVSGAGRISRTGKQQVGVPRSRQDLRVAIATAPLLVSQLHPVTGEPPPGLGEIGDFAYDPFLARWYGPKSSLGWGAPTLMVKPLGAIGHWPVQGSFTKYPGFAVCS